ncbi:MAG: hypothetical protein CMJ75_19405 [Planctomycetaceae bacterium]|nr:hypothetical protein [Planctomycetaceae bacterium]
MFGYDILFPFMLISLLKWGLVFTMARHMVLSGVHPYRRMIDLPGPRGWFPLMLLLIGSLTTPIWTGFFPGILGNFTSQVTGTEGYFNGAVDYLWGGAFLAGILVLSASGGYSVLERVQIFIVGAMMICAVVSLFIYQPDWIDMLLGGILPRSFDYPDWVADKYPIIAEKSVWVETSTYVGVIGGAGFDYLAYTSWLREKYWGRSSAGAASEQDLAQIAEDDQHSIRFWVRAPLVDCTLSFVLVVVFSAVFVALGAEELQPAHEVPTGDNFLDMQSRFITKIHSALYPLYAIGVYMTFVGTLYGTYEIGIAVCQEIVRALNPDVGIRHAARLKKLTLTWCSCGAAVILVWSFLHTYRGGAIPSLSKAGFTSQDAEQQENSEKAVTVGALVTQIETGGPADNIGLRIGDVIVRFADTEIRNESDLQRQIISAAANAAVEVAVVRAGQPHKILKLTVRQASAGPRILEKILRPANFFTGVFACGLLCWLMPWVDRKFLPRPLRMSPLLIVLNIVAGSIFLFLGMKAYWDNHTPGGVWYENRWFSIGTIVGMGLLAMLLAPRVVAPDEEPAS